MIKAVDKVLNDTVFKILIVAITFFMQVHFIHVMYGGYVKYVLAFGMLVCVWQLLNKTLFGKLNDKVSILLLAFSVSYAITIFINRDNCFSQNFNQLVYMVVFFLLLFMVEKEKTYHDVKRDMVIVSWVIVLLSVLLALLTIGLHVNNIGEWYKVEGSDSYFFIGNGLYAFWSFCNPNTGGAIAVVSLLASLMLINNLVESKNKIIGSIGIVFLIINILCEYICILLLESRGAYYGLLAALPVWIFIFSLKNFKKINRPLRAIVAICLSVVVFSGCISLTTNVKKLTEAWVVVSSEDAEDISKDTDFENTIESVLKNVAIAGTPLTGKIGDAMSTTSNIAYDIEESIGRDSQEGNFTTGRTGLWAVGVAAFKSAPIFGLTREGMIPEICALFSAETNTGAMTNGGLHNMYLTVLCASGIVGFIILAAAVCIVLYRFFKCLIKSPQIDMYMLFAFVLCLFFFVTELVENRILYQVNFFNVVFWIYFGYLNKLSLLKLEEISEK